MIAAIVSAATMLGTEVAKGVAGEAGKSLWGSVKNLLGMKNDPAPEVMSQELTTSISDSADPAIIAALLALLKSQPQSPWGQMVVNIKADNVLLAQQVRDVYIGGASQPAVQTVAQTLHRLPSDIEDFTGREEQISELLSKFSGGEQGAILSGLKGLGGVGKTALAIHIAHKLTDQFPDAQLFINLRGAGTDLQGNPVEDEALTPVEALTELVQPFHPEAKLPDDLPSLRALFLESLRGKKSLVVLDNAKDAEQVTPICPGAELDGCAVLITSRRRIVLSGITTVDLDVMPKDEAVDLLQTICGRIGDDDAITVAKLCGYLPLALRLAASMLQASDDIPVSDYIKRLKNEDSRLEALSYENRSVAAVLNLSVAELDEETRAQWAALSVFPGSFISLAAAAVWELSNEKAQLLISEFLRLSLVIYSKKSERYRLHDHLRLLAKDHIEEAAEYRSALRHAEYYMRVLRETQSLYKEGGDKFLAGLALFDSEWINISAGQAWAVSHLGSDKAATTLCNYYSGVGTFILPLRLHPKAHLPWVESALRAAQTLEDREAEQAHLTNLGLVWSSSGKPVRSIKFFEKALLIAREIGSRRGEGSSLGNLGGAYFALNELDRALKYYQEQLAIVREIGDRRGMGNALLGLGNTYFAAGDQRRAIEYFEKGLVIFREIGDLDGEGNALGNIGSAYSRLGEPRCALKYHEEQFAIARKIGDLRGVAHTSWNRGFQLAKLGDPEHGLGLMQSFVDYQREVGHPDAENKATQLDELRRKLESESGE